MRFRLSKWYLDCATDKGDLFVGYAASLSLGVIPLHLISRLTMIDQDVEQVTTSSWSDRAPSDTETELTWSSRKLGVAGTWMRRLPATTRTLFEGDRGSVVWHCAQPLSQVTVVCSGKDVMRGLGYVERLDMNIGPSEIGLTTLYWGRFLAPDVSVVWVKWCGKESREIVLFNGEETPSAALAENRLSLGDCRIVQLSDAVPIRAGQLEDSVLGSLPFLRKMLPGWVGGISESKWRSRGTLERNGQVIAEGWAIHEEVSFNR
jgi:hypothetical protein